MPADGYVTETPYVWGYYASQSPALLGHVAKLRGWAARDLAAPFTYCELGCGTGGTSLTLADAFPHATFVAIDVNPEHIETAEAVRVRAGLENLTFIAADFEEALAQDLPQFNFITMHGVYTWVSARVRQQILALLDQHLAPDGLVSVSYNALPGWAELMPLREMLVARAQSVEGTPLEKLEEGLQFLERLQKADAPYFRSIPSAANALAGLREESPQYLVHEYLNEHWQPMTVTEVARDMAGIGLQYVGSSQLEQNYPELTVPQRFVSLLDRGDDVVAYEAQKSLVLAEAFRKDIYRRGGPPDPPSERLRLFAETRFGSIEPPGAPLDELVVGQREMRFTKPLFAPLVAAAGDGAYTLTELTRLPELAAFSDDEILRALLQLVAAGRFAEFVRPGVAAGAAHGDRYTLGPLSRTIVLDRLTEGGECDLASPVLGNGLRARVFGGILALATAEAGLAQAEERAFALLEQHALWPDGAASGERAKRAQIAGALAAFKAEWLPVLLRLGILTRE